MKMISESPLLYALAIMGICYTTGVAIIFLRKSWSRAKEIGITKKELSNVVKSSLSFSIVPSMAVLAGFFGLVALLGIPWPWARLSFIGSVGYEVMAAETAVKSVGSSIANATNKDFVLIMYVMSICALGGLVGSIFLTKKLQSGTAKIKNRDPKWGPLGNSTFMLTIIIVFLVPMILSGGVELLTLLTSAAVALLITIIVKKFNAGWLSGFTLALSMIVAMVSSVFWTKLL